MLAAPTAPANLVPSSQSFRAGKNLSDGKTPDYSAADKDNSAMADSSFLSVRSMQSAQSVPMAGTMASAMGGVSMNNPMNDSSFGAYSGTSAVELGGGSGVGVSGGMSTERHGAALDAAPVSNVSSMLNSSNVSSNNSTKSDNAANDNNVNKGNNVDTIGLMGAVGTKGGKGSQGSVNSDTDSTGEREDGGDAGDAGDVEGDEGGDEGEVEGSDEEGEGGGKGSNSVSEMDRSNRPTAPEKHEDHPSQPTTTGGAPIATFQNTPDEVKFQVGQGGLKPLLPDWKYCEEDQVRPSFSPGSVLDESWKEHDGAMRAGLGALDSYGSPPTATYLRSLSDLTPMSSFAGTPISSRSSVETLNTLDGSTSSKKRAGKDGKDGKEGKEMKGMKENKGWKGDRGVRNTSKEGGEGKGMTAAMASEERTKEARRLSNSVAAILASSPDTTPTRAHSHTHTTLADGHTGDPADGPIVSLGPVKVKFESGNLPPLPGTPQSVPSKSLLSAPRRRR